MRHYRQHPVPTSCSSAAAVEATGCSLIAQFRIWPGILHKPPTCYRIVDRNNSDDNNIKTMTDLCVVGGISQTLLDLCSAQKSRMKKEKIAGSSRPPADVFKAKLKTQLQVLSETLQPHGYTLSQLETEPSRLFHMNTTFKLKVNRHEGIHIQQSLPPPTTTSCRDHEPDASSLHRPTETTLPILLQTTVAVTQIAEKQPSKMPVDLWVIGGLALRLSRDRYQASAKSRRFGLILASIALVVAFIFAPSHKKRAHPEAFIWRFYSLAMVGLFVILFLYFQEFVDGKALHAVSRACVSDFSNLTAHRHGIVLEYEIERGGLPGTTVGRVKFIRTMPATIQNT